MGISEPKMPTAEDLAKTQQETGGESDPEKEKQELEARLAEIHEQYKELFDIRTKVFGEFAKTGALKPPSSNFERYLPDETRAHDQVFMSAWDKVKLAKKEGKEADLTDYERIAYELQIKFNTFDREREGIANKLKDLEKKPKSQEPEQITVNESAAESSEEDKLKAEEVLARIKSM